MSHETSSHTLISRNAADVVARIVVVGFFAGLTYRVGLDVLETSRLSGVLFLTNELLVVMFTLTRRFASRVDGSTLARIVTVLGTLGPLLARPDPRYVQLAEAVVVPVSLLGVAIVVVGKLSLGRSFGLLPAHRGIVSSGLYRMVRHPIYLGYCLSHGAFLLANASPWNLAVFLIAETSLLVRIGAEERVLLQDDAYERYHQTVRYRLVPGIY